MTKKFDWHSMSKIPNHSQEALKNYFLYAYQPGGFLTGLLNNDPVADVISRADMWNKQHLGDIIEWLFENAPNGSWGSRDRVQSWLDKGPAFVQFEKSRVLDILSTEHTEPTYYDF